MHNFFTYFYIFSKNYYKYFLWRLILKENKISTKPNNQKSISSIVDSVKQYLHKIFYEDNPTDYDFTIGETTNSVVIDKSTTFPSSAENLELTNESLQCFDTSKDTVFQSLDVNLEYIKVRFNSMVNSDVIIREFTLNARGKQYRAFLVFIDGMINADMINNFILKPLMLKNTANSFDGSQNRVLSEVKTNNITVRKVKKFDILEYISTCLLPQNAVNKFTKFDDIIAGINAGNCALFLDTINFAFDIEVKGFSQRGLGNPENEIVIRGAQVGFTENLRTNTSLLRRYVNNENLIIESTNVGKISKTPCAVCYLKNVANSDLVAEVKYRINNLGVDYLISSGQLEQLIQDDDNSSIPQMVSTERPDRACNLLFVGRVIVLVNGSPYALVVPAIFSDFLDSSEDLNLKHQYSNFIRVLRIIAFVISLFLPGFYIAITNFHQEVIPTELLFAIVASRESVPFPVLFEILVMEFSFELIREASIRVPSPIGPTIGIVGALILGQAAVEANVVSPILIIIVSITAICSFAVPDFSLGFHFRIMRFFYIILGAIAGFLGLAAGFCIHLIVLCNLKSFGVHFFEINMFQKPRTGNGTILAPTWKRENRPRFLKSKRPKSQDDISMKWRYNKK